MPKRGKGREEDGNPSSGDFDGDAPAKKGAKRSFGGSSVDGNVVCEILRNGRVLVRVWQGKPTVDIEFYVKDGKQMPGKKVGHADYHLTGLRPLCLARLASREQQVTALRPAKDGHKPKGRPLAPVCEEPSAREWVGPHDTLAWFRVRHM
ncbi:RNA polymerase II transcriptional coactivator [Nymphaea thermarum]|nr:RNA polymerase II transcriptional coactivator [Nymphaea thermarum]